MRVPTSSALLLAAMLLPVLPPVSTTTALTIELRDVAPDRIERQRANAAGHLPLAGTPDLARFEARRSELGIEAGAPVLIRIFKSEMELELWARRGGAYVLFATYPLCHWSGTVGPKIKEGDRQTPEGFYTVTSRQLHHVGRWPRSLNLGFPNAFDRALSRNGSYILLHGGCSSTGCFAVTNPVISEIYRMTTEALRAGQRHVPIHIFPFRMTDPNLRRHSDSEWFGFWQNLSEASASFERTRLPPLISVCNGRYVVRDASADAPETQLERDESSTRRRQARRSDRNAGAILNACPADVAAARPDQTSDPSSAAAPTGTDILAGSTAGPAAGPEHDGPPQPPRDDISGSLPGATARP